MSDEFLFPDVGEGIAEGKLVEWKVSAGDEVAEDQVVADVETDKAVVEIPSPRAGTIAELKYEPGDVIKVGEVLLTFGDAPSPSQEPTEEASEEPQEKQPKTKDHEVEGDHEREPERGTKKVESSLTPTAPKPEQHEPPITVQEQKTDAQGPVEHHEKRVLAAPSTRRLAREKGIDLTTIQGSGPAGRILRSDLEATTTQGQASPKQAPQPTPENPQPQKAPQQTQESAQPPAQQSQPQPPASSESSVEYSGRRKAIGKHMEASNAVPAVSEFATADVTALVELREHLKEKADELGVKLTYLAFFSKAVCAAIRKFPVMNSHFADESIQVFDDVHLGIAVDTQQGLVVPVVQSADRKSALEIAQDIETLAQQARDNQLSAQQMQGSTFSISSIGKSRVEFFTPMINTPEAAILGIGGFRQEPRIHDDEVDIRTVAPLSVTYDHRVVDGAQAAQFLTYLVELIEDPELLVLGGI